MPVRVSLRTVWRSGLTLAVLFGGVAGLAGASLSTAEHIESAYDDLVREVAAPQLVVGCFDCGSGEQFESFIAGLRADPAVAYASPISRLVPVLRSIDGTLLGPTPTECGEDSTALAILTSEWSGSPGPPGRFVEGRPAGTAAEIALPLVTAQRAGVAVGDEVALEEVCHSWSPLAAPIRLKVVGLFVGVLDVRPPGQSVSVEAAFVTSDFAEATGATAEAGGFALWLVPGRTLSDVEAIDASSVLFDTSSHASDIRSHLRPDATALRLFAALIIAAAIAVLAQLLARHIRATARNHSHLRSLGWRPIDLALGGVVHGVIVGIAAGIAATAATVGLERAIPLGAADYAAKGADQPLGWSTALAAAAAIAGIVILLSIAPAFTAARHKPLIPPVHRSLISRFANRARLRTSPSLGVRFALEPADRARNATVRNGLGSVVLATAVVCGVVTFANSLDHLRATPRLVGWTWDVMVSSDEPPPREALDALLANNPAVDRWGWGNSGVGLTLEADADRELKYVSFSTGPSAVKPVAIKGRAPEGADEILLTSEVAAAAHVEIGDVVDITVEDWLGSIARELGAPTDRAEVRTLTFELVGIGVVFVSSLERGGATITTEGVERIFAPPTRAETTAVLAAADFGALVESLTQEFPSLAEQLESGGAAGVAATLDQWTDEDFESIVPSPTFHRVYIDLVDGEPPTDILAELNRLGIGVDGAGVEGVVDGRLAVTTEVVALDLADVNWLPAGLGVVMSMTAGVVVAHLIATGTRARRRDLAILQALGFSRSQVRRVVFWQALALASVASIIAVPIGAVAGRFFWHRYAEGIKVVPEPVTPWWGLILVLAAVVVVAQLAAVGPAFVAGRSHPLDSLRSE